MAHTIPPLDPEAPRPLLHRALAAFARTRVGRWFGIEISSRIDPWLLRVSRGRLSSFPTAPMLLLTVPGRRSGVPRTRPLLYFTQGDDVILIASSFGREQHPGWYRNVVAHPDVTLTAGGVSAPYTGREVTDPAERRRLLDLARGVYEGYGDYEARTAAIRDIPVLRLSPAG